MKVLVNGGINLSELDGWWSEAYCPDLGWAIGDGQEHGSNPAWDDAEAEMLYRALEQEVVPEFYARNEQAIPSAWVARMRESIARLTPQFSANRAVREYTEKCYLPAARNYQSRTAQKGLLGRQMIEFQRRSEKQWSAIQFGEVKVETRGGQHIFEIQVLLSDLDPQAVRVELYANGVRDEALVRQEMKLSSRLPDLPGGYVYCASVSADRPSVDYTARLVPRRDGAAIPLEDARILWQR
jgi:glycogen phosphorylase